ncbi:hypothetical protein GH733_005743, partial [Mirounga leonina]
MWSALGSGARIFLFCRRHDAVIISGTEMARQIQKEIQRGVESWISLGNRRPHLSIILVGDNPASHTYVRKKIRAASAVGICSEIILKPKDVSQEELLDANGLYWKLNHVDERTVCNGIAPEKDVDGFHIINVGRLCLDQHSLIPATASAVWEIIKRTGDATVTIAHRYTPKEQLKIHTQLADVIIVAAGIPKLITSDMVKEGAAVIDVGINYVHDPVTGKTKLVGDVDFEATLSAPGDSGSGCLPQETFVVTLSGPNWSQCGNAVTALTTEAAEPGTPPITTQPSNWTVNKTEVDYTEGPIALKFSHPCLEDHNSYCINGVCAFHHELEKAICTCFTGYTGERCEHLTLTSYAVDSHEKYIAIGIGVGLLL